MNHTPPGLGLFEVMRKQLHRAHLDGRALSIAELEYWGERFMKRHVRFWSAMTFEQYLLGPERAEVIVKCRKAVHVLRGVEHGGVLPIAGQWGVHRFIISLN